MNDSSSAASSRTNDRVRADLRNWKVAGGVVRRGADDVLLVENERKDRSVDWSTPGGVVDAGETFVEALRRGPLYRVEVVAPDLGFFLEVEAHGALEITGEVLTEINDPDGIVLSASFLSIEHASHRLGGAARFVREPLLAHLIDGVDDGRTFAYRIVGRGRDRVIERIDD